MEHTRVILAIALSFLVFLVWQFFFTPRQPVPKPEESQTASRQTDERTGTEKPYAPSPESAKPTEKPTPEVVSAPTGRTITIDTDLYRAELTEDGAAIRSFVLKKYREFARKDSPLKEMVPSGIPGGTVLVSLSDKSIPDLNDAVYTVTADADRIKVSDKPVEVTFKWTNPQGVLVEKVYRFDPQTYLVGLTVSVKNGSERPIKDRLAVTLDTILSTGGRQFGFVGPSAYIDKKLEQIKIKDIKEKSTYEGTIDWVAVQARYFMSCILPEKPTQASFHLASRDDDRVVAEYILPENTFPPGTQQAFDFEVFMGPKSMRLLDSYGHNLGKAVNFGMFDVLAKPCLWLMNFIHDHVIANYGVAIIILTLLTKILLWPLGTKSYKSMSDMKKLQPLIKEIKEKYRDDRKRVNEETMALYRTYKINPLGGCLPMLVQIPVFFALYRMLYEAIELRHAPFFLWINDLSAPDRLFHFGFSIPFMDPPYGIPVLTLVMGATMFLQQKMSPPMGDATQAKMMMLMPVIFTFIFINFSSGLVLYWLVNNIVSIAQQYYITKKNA